MAFKAIIDETEFQALPEPVQKEYVQKGDKYEIQVEGMKTQADVDRLQGALTKERNDHKTAKDQLGLITAGGRKVEDVLATLDRVPELEAAAEGKLDEEKLNGLVEGRIKSRLAPVERERDQLKSQLSEKEKVIETFTTKERTRTIHDKVREAGVKAKILPEALEDALLLADRVFEIEEGTNKVITRDNVGVTPGIEPEAWFTDMQSKRAHWWGPSGGGGANGNRGGLGAGEKNPFTAEHWNMTEQGKLVTSDRAKAEQLAKLAGTTIGGPKPAAKK